MSHASDVTSIEDAKRLIEARNLDYIKVGLFDLDGVMRGKYMSRAQFFGALENGSGFCNVLLGEDCQDQLYSGLDISHSGWHTGFADIPVRIVPDTCRAIPFEDNTLLFLLEFDGDAAPLCPRRLLQSTAQKARAMGFKVKAALEYEFFLFNETPQSAREKHYRNLQTFTPDLFGYSILRNSVHSELYHDLLQLCQTMDLPVESIHTETGPGVIEAALAADSAVNAADKAALFKTFTKVWAQRRNLMATFMARWSEKYSGQSGHIHMSLLDLEDRPVFYDPDKAHGISRLQRHFIAGQQHLLPQLLAMMAPTINAYARLAPGFWAPTAASWGVDNRTVALRVISGSQAAQRVEHRLASADANPYLAMAAALGAGLYGIENKLEPLDPVQGNAYSQSASNQPALPASLAAAAQALRASAAARQLFGDTFVDHYAASREWEVSEFNKHVTDWELARYFEII